MTRKFFITAVFMCLIYNFQVHAELYRWVDEHGNVHFSDQKNSNKATNYTPSDTISTYSHTTLVQTNANKDSYSDLPPYEQRRESPDINKLHAVKFPSKPNRTSIATYIQKIYALSRLQKNHLRSDPQVSLLMQVGEEYLDVLIRETYSHVGWHNYGIEAIKKLATERHKPLIFKALKHYNKYAEVIYIKNWHFEVQDELIRGLRNNKGYVPSEWLKAVSEFNRDDARHVLVEYFKYGWNNHSTYNIISTLSNIENELAEAIPVAWETARENNKIAMGALTSKALELGYMPAFRFVMISLLDNANIQKHWFDAYALATRYTNQTGTAREIMGWYKANKGRIKFNPDQKIFSI